ncbi:MAG: PD-(D/E)XK nuclease family protein [Methanomassiliicoccus sp.]|nr:PD-(D/E)XK nuclease family protein [Methanomassiliicoccus sp.]
MSGRGQSSGTASNKDKDVEGLVAGTDVYSHSRLSCYEQCPRRYRYRYIDEIEVEDVQGIEAFIGTLVHLSLQHLYERAGDSSVPTCDDLLEHFDHLWGEMYDPSKVKIVRKEMTCSDHCNRAKDGLKAYHRRHHPFDRGTTVGLEHEVRFTVGGRYSFKGYIDRLTSLGDGEYEVCDYKTGKRLPTARALNEDRQLGLYEMGVRQSFPDARRVRLVWHYIAHDRELESFRTPEQLDRLEEDVCSLIGRIEAACSFPRKQGPLCQWCEYCDICDGR